MRLDEDVLIVTLSKAGTIRGASRDLYISQPAISQRLKQIEERWGEPLFIRTHKSLIPTPVGEELIAYSIKRLADERKLQDRLSEVTGSVRGTLSLAVSSVIAQYYLPQLLRSYIETYPNVKIDLQTGLSSAMYKERHNAHLSILRGEVDDADSLTKLFSEKLYYVTKKNNPSTQTLIEFQSDQAFHSQLETWFQTTISPSPTQTIKVDQIETCKQLMYNGIGGCILPEIATKDISAEDCHFIPVMLDEAYLQRDTWIHCHMKYAKLPQVQAFLDLLNQSYQ